MLLEFLGSKGLILENTFGESDSKTLAKYFSQAIAPALNKRIKYEPDVGRKPSCSLDLKLEAMCHMMITGSKYRDEAKEYGIKRNPLSDFVKMLAEGDALEEILHDMVLHLHKKGLLEIDSVIFDSTTIKSVASGKDGIGNNGHKLIMGTKIQIGVDKNGIPIHADCHAANINDVTAFQTTLPLFMEEYPEELTGSIAGFVLDGGFTSEENRDLCKKYGKKGYFPSRKNAVKPIPKSEKEHIRKVRWVVEQAIAILMGRFRRPHLRYEKRADKFFAMVVLSLICSLILKFP